MWNPRLTDITRGSSGPLDTRLKRTLIEFIRDNYITIFFNVIKVYLKRNQKGQFYITKIVFYINAEHWNFDCGINYSIKNAKGMQNIALLSLKGSLKYGSRLIIAQVSHL